MAQFEPEMQDIHGKIMDECESHFNGERFSECIKLLHKAWNNMPTPQTQWNESFHVALGTSPKGLTTIKTEQGCFGFTILSTVLI